MEARSRIAHDAQPAAPAGQAGSARDPRFARVAPAVAELFRALQESGAEPESVTRLVRQARYWEIKATLADLAQAGPAEASYWPLAVQAVEQLFGAEQVTLWAPAEEGFAPTARSRAGAEADVPLPPALLHGAIASGHVNTAATRDARGELRLSLLAPLATDQGLEGVVQVVLPSLTMRPEQVEDLTLASAQLLSGLSLVRRLERLAFDASHDPLTGLANRRTFQEVVEREFRLVRRHGNPMAVLMIDVDHFKAYNDTYGHPAGDALLKAVAQAISQSVRSTDFVARYGGEEFVVVLPHTGAEGARAAAEKVLQAIRRLPEHQRVLGGRVTASVGVASCDGSPCTIEQLLAEADQALYRAKEAGRDRLA